MPDSRAAWSRVSPSEVSRVGTHSRSGSSARGVNPTRLWVLSATRLVPVQSCGVSNGMLSPLASRLSTTIHFVPACTALYIVSINLISASQARQTLPAQLDRVEAGEEVAITRHGRVVAVLVRPGVLAARRAAQAWNQADRIGELLANARDQPLQDPVISADRAEELVERIRLERSGA